MEEREKRGKKGAEQDVQFPRRQIFLPGEKQYLRRLGARMANARNEARLTQKEMAERLGISREHLSRLEAGVSRTPAFFVVLLARHLGIPASRLIEDTDTG